MKQKTVTILDEHEEWLKEHGEINLSGFLRKKLDELIKGTQND